MRLIEAATPWQILFYRSLALALFLGALLRIGGRGGAGRRFQPGPALACGICVSGAFIGFVFAITHTTVANTFFLLATQPLLTALLAWGGLGERPERRTWHAMGVAALGIALMVADGLGTGTLFGNAMALVSAVGFSSLTITLRRFRAHDHRQGIALGGVLTAAAAAVMIGWAALLGTDPGPGASPAPAAVAFAVSGRDLALCVTSGTIQIGLGMLLYTLGTRRIGAGEAALFALSEVLLAPIWVWLALDEVPSGLTLAGGAAVLSAVMFRAWPSVRTFSSNVEATS